MTYVPWQKRNDPKTATERGIVRTLIRVLIDAGYEITVDNGEDDLVSTSKTEIFDYLCQTDNDTLSLYKAGETPKIVWLVWGNDPWEVVADYSESLEDLLKPVWEACEKAEAR